jgi:hypothetical protein
LLPAVVAFGVLFSGYLTFLEPFVIGAVCMWCVSSAVVMLALLWVTGYDGQVIGWERAARRMAEPVADRAAIAEPEAEEAPSPAAAAEPLVMATPEPSPPGRGRVIRYAVIGIGYLLALAVGVALAAGVVHVYKTTFTPPLVVSVAAANRRAAIEDGILVAGLVLGPLVWTAVYRRWR